MAIVGNYDKALYYPSTVNSYGNFSDYNSKQKETEMRNNMEGEPGTKHMYSFKSNFSTVNNVEEEIKKVADSGQLAIPSFINSYISFIKNRNKNISLNLPPERSQPCSFKKNDLRLPEKNNYVIVKKSSYLKERKKKKNHDSQLENTIHCDSALGNDTSCKLSLPENGKSISSLNKSLEYYSGLTKSVSESNYKKKKRKEHCGSSSIVETAINYDSSIENDRTAAVTELTSPVNRKSISLENKCLEEGSGVTESINESNYLKRRKKKKYHSPKLKNMLQQDLTLKNDRSREVTEIRSCELSSSVNRKSVSSENVCLEGNGVTEPINESNYLNRKKKKKYHSPKLKNTLHQDSSIKNDRSREVTEIRSEVSLPVNEKSISSDDKSLENCEVSEITNESNYFKKGGKKKHCDSSRSENGIHYDSVLDKVRNGEVTEIIGCEKRLPLNRKSISSENKFLESNSGVPETAIESNYLNKRKKKKRRHSPGMDNMLHRDSSLLEKNRSLKIVEMCSSALSSVVNRKHISSENYELKENNEVSEIVNGSKYFKKGAKNRGDSSRLENATCYESSLQNDRSREVIEIRNYISSSPVNRKSISSKNKSLEKQCDVSEITNESNYLKKKKKKEVHHSPNLENMLRDSTLLEKDRNLEISELCSSELSSSVNRKYISSENDSQIDREVSEFVNGTNYLKKTEKNCHYSSRLENEIHYDLPLENDTSREVIKIRSYESPVHKKAISSKEKALENNCGISETTNESSYLKEKKKKNPHDSRLENAIHYDSLLANDRNREVTEIRICELSSPVNGKSVSSENISLENDSGVSENTNKSNYLQKKDKRMLHHSSELENMLYDDSPREMDISSEVIVISSSESISPIKRKYVSSENKLLKKNSDGSNTVNKSNYLKKSKKKKLHDFTKLENVRHDSSPEKKRNMEVIEICSSELSSLSLSSENSVFVNSISLSKKKRKRQRNNSLMNKCEDRVTLTNRKREQSCTNHSIAQIIEDIDTVCLVRKSGSTSSPERKKRKTGEINCESSGLKRKQKKMQRQTNQNAADNCVVEQSPSLPAPSSKSVGNGKREKYQCAIQNESSISHDEANADLCTSRREPSFIVTSQVLEKNNNTPICKVFPVLTPLSHKLSKEHNSTIQNECDLNGSINTELFQNGSKFSRLPNREMGTQKEINSECPMLTSKEKKKQRETSRNVIFHPELGSQPLLCKKKNKNEHRNKDTSHSGCNENFISDFCSPESESCVKSIGTIQKKNEAQFKNVMTKSKENNFHKQTNNFTICNASENSPSSVLPSSSCEEIGKPVNTNLNVLNVDSNESVYDVFENERCSSRDLLAFYANKIGNKKEVCDKIWNDAVTAEFGRSTLKNYREVDVNIRHDIPVLHLLDYSVCTVPTKEEREQLVSMGMKEIPFNKSEDAIIMNNWDDLCEDNGVSSSALLENIIKRVGGYKTTKKKIVQFLGNGLPDRALYQIYHRFILLSSSKRGQFTEEEDYILLKAVNSHVKEKYAILSSILRRSRNTIYKRHRRLLTFPRETTGYNEKMKMKWDITFASKVVKLLMCISGASSIEDFRDSILSNDLLRQMEKEMKIPHWKLHQFWNYKLHVQLFAETPVCEKQIQKKIVKWIYRKNYSTEKEIEWSQSRHLLFGSTSSFMWLQFRLVKYNFQFKNFNGLRDFIKAVYSQRNAFDGASRYLARYKVNEDFSLSIVNDEYVKK